MTTRGTDSGRDWTFLDRIERGQEELPPSTEIRELSKQNRLGIHAADAEAEMARRQRELFLLSGSPTDLVELDRRMAELDALREQGARRDEVLRRLLKKARLIEEARMVPELAKKARHALRNFQAAQATVHESRADAEAAASRLMRIYGSSESLPYDVRSELPPEEDLRDLEEEVNRVLQAGTRFRFRRPRRPEEAALGPNIRRVGVRHE